MSNVKTKPAIRKVIGFWYIIDSFNNKNDIFVQEFDTWREAIDYANKIA